MAKQQAGAGYFDTVMDGYNVLIDAAERNRRQALAAYEAVVSNIASVQRDFWGAARLVTEPAGATPDWSGVSQATARIQQSSVELATLAYEQTMEAGAGVWDLYDRLRKNALAAVAALMDISLGWRSRTGTEDVPVTARQAGPAIVRRQASGASRLMAFNIRTGKQAKILEPELVMLKNGRRAVRGIAADDRTTRVFRRISQDEARLIEPA